jgi:riboflavin synthase
MFTGLVQGIGSVAAIERSDDGARITIATPLSAELRAGDSIAVNGVCLTAVSLRDGSFSVEAMNETLARTSLGDLVKGAGVNVELALRAGDRLGGHMVQGHVDGLGEVVELAPAARSTTVRIRVPQALSRYVAQKGSIAVDGVSLTVNAVQGDTFEVNVIPHTQAVTVIGEYRRGVAVNIEVDIIARYLERLGSAEATVGKSAGAGMELLRRHGYAHEN